MTPADVRAIASAFNLPMAEFCVEQEAGKIGRAAADPLYLMLATIEGESIAANDVEDCI